MKYTASIEINLPIQRVIELFDNPEHMKHWQPRLQSFEHISGRPGEPGAKSKLVYKMGKRIIEMEETILKRDLPHAFNGHYEAKGVKNWIWNRFQEVDKNKTKWIAENEFQFQGFMKLIAFLMPGSFKKQSMKYLEQFKDFAENKAL